MDTFLTIFLFVLGLHWGGWAGFILGVTTGPVTKLRFKTYFVALCALWPWYIAEMVFHRNLRSPSLYENQE